MSATAPLTEPSTSQRDISPARAADPLSLVCKLSGLAAATNDPSEFGRQAAMTAAGFLGGSHFAWCEASPDGLRLEVAIEPSPHQRQWTNGCRFVAPLDEGDNLFGAALSSNSTRQAVDISSQLAEDEFLGELDFGAAVVAPVRQDGRPLGALAVFDRAVRSFNAEHIALVTSLANIVCATVVRCRAEQAYERERQMSASLRNSMESIMLVIEADGRIAAANEACNRLTGFTSEELAGRSIWSAMLLPEEFAQIKQSFARAQSSGEPERFESYVLTKDGRRRRVAWSLASLDRDPTGGVSSVATGIDITERCEAVERAVQAEAIAQDARNTMHEMREAIDQGEQGMAANPAARRLPTGIDHDRRARPRRDYPYVQRIAPHFDDQVPAETAFSELQCRDISSRGFAFLTPTPLQCDKVVVAFGTPPAVVYLTAEVRHRTEKEVNGRRQFVVGCRYTGRVTKQKSG